MEKPYFISWANGYEKFETHKELKDFCDYRGISYLAYTFRDSDYNAKDEMYRISDAGCGRYRNITTAYQPELINVTVFYDNIKPDYDEATDGENLTVITMPKDVLFDWFKENILKNFRSDVDEGVSDEGVFEEWLDEYTADDTDGLYQAKKQFISVSSEDCKDYYYSA